jgi:putative endonuclease
MYTVNVRRLHLAMYYVYILECEDFSLYTGCTNDVERRFAQHQAGKGGHYTRAKKPVRILYTEEQIDRGSALRREAEIKQWSREKKLELINAGHQDA